MTIAKRVRTFIEERSPAAFCDDCIVDELHLMILLHANKNTRRLADEEGFERRPGACSVCGVTRKVIRSTIHLTAVATGSVASNV